MAPDPVGRERRARDLEHRPELVVHLDLLLRHDLLRHLLEATTLTINAFFNWEFNSCESLRKDGVWHPIDFANPCPDSQVTSLHYHWPWLVESYLKWAIFCATTRRKLKRDFEWESFSDIAKQDLPYPEKLSRYGAIARKRFDATRFEEFCAMHLKHFDEVAWAWFGTDACKDEVRKKVAALYPAHEVEQFTELFWTRIQQWRKEQKP